MPPSTVTVERTEPVLSLAADWEMWILVIERMANAADVWKYIDPDKTDAEIDKLSPPEEPNPTSYGATIADDESTIPDTRTAAWQTANANYSRTLK